MEEKGPETHGIKTYRQIREDMATAGEGSTGQRAVRALVDGLCPLREQRA